MSARKKIVQNFDAIVLLIPPLSSYDLKSNENKVYRELVTGLRKNKVKVLDPSSFFASVKNPIKHYHFPRDAHWNAEAHKIISDQLGTTLTSWKP